MELSILRRTGFSESDLSMSAKSFAIEAQKTVNALTRKLENDKEKLYFKLIKQGVGASSLYISGSEKLEAEYEKKLSDIAAELDFKIRFVKPSDGGSTGGGADSGSGGTGEGGEEHVYSYPNDPDYSLDYAERYYVVYDYYMTMSDPNARFALFQVDNLAKSYLGDFYATLYDRLRLYTK